MHRVLLKDLATRADRGKSLIGTDITIAGWVKTGRDQGKGAFAFLNINDGTHPEGIQVIVDKEVHPIKDLIPTGTSIAVRGQIVESLGGEQAVELKATEVLFVGACDATKYPLAAKAHSLEYLRSIAHFRSRSNLVILRIFL